MTLPDGTQQKVLVPQLYLMPRAGDLRTDGTLIAGQTVHIAASGDITNSGTVAGRDLLDLSAANLTNLGRLSANTVSLNATNDIANLGGRIEAVDSLSLSAGRDLTVATTTAGGDGAAGFGQFSRTQVDRVAGLYVTGSAGSLSAVAGRDLTLNAAEVVNAGTGTTTLVAGNDLNLGTVTTRDAVDITRDARNHARLTASSEVGTRITTVGDLNLGAGNDLNGRAADLQAQGDLNVAAGNDVVFAAGRNTLSVDVASYSKDKAGGGLTKKTVTRSMTTQADTVRAVTGRIAGRNVTVQAGQDIALEGGQVTAQDQLALSAGRDLNIAAGESSDASSRRLQVGTKETLGFGTTRLTTTRDEVTVTPDVAQLSARDITLNAGRDLTLVAPTLTAETLSATAGGQLTVAAATATHELKTTSEFKTNRFNFSEVTAPLQGRNGIQNSLGLVTMDSFVTGARIKDKIKLDTAGSQRSAVVAELTANDIALNSGGDTTLVAPRIVADSLAISAGQSDPEGRIALLGVKESTTTSGGKNSHSFVHQTVRDGGQSAETLLLPDIRTAAEVGLTVNDENPPNSTQLTLNAPGGIVVGATDLAPTRREAAQAGGGASPSGGRLVDLQAQAQTLARQPGLAWLGEVAQRQDVDWQKIELATQNWDYKHAGLTQEGAIVVAIVVTILTWGAASSAGTALATEAGMTTTSATAASASSVAAAGAGVAGSGVAAGTVLTTAGAAVSAAAAAGLTTLASQAAVSLINNQGDVGKTLQDLGSKDSVKQLVASMLTAGVTSGVSSAFNLPTGAELSKAGFTTRFATYATKAAVSAGVQSAVYGTPLSETAKTALVNSLAQTLTSEIGDWGKSDPALVAKTLAHAVVQCAAASVQGNDCGAAALGAATAEALSPLLDSVDASTRAAGFQQSLGASIAGMGAMLAASLTGKDPITAMNAAQMVDNYNRQLHPAEIQRIKELANGDPQKEARLTEAACALARCADGVPQTDPSYATLKALQDAGSKLTEEQILLKQQSGWDGRTYGSLFQYTWGQQLTDSFTANQVETRLVGAVQTVGGTAGVVGSGALCSSGFGCAAGAITGTVSLDYALAGLQQAATGQNTTPYGEQVLQSLGMSPQAAAYTYAALGLAPASLDAVLAAKAADAASKYNMLARSSYADFSTQGIEATATVMASPQAQAMINELKAASPTLSSAKVNDYVKQWIESGASLPIPATAGPGSVLLKAVPQGESVSSISAFWLSPEQARTLATMTSEQAGQALGLPAAQAAKMLKNGIDYYAISPKPGVRPTVFVSEVAPTTQGIVRTTPNSTQVIVPNRTLWTEPKPINPFTLR